MRHDEIQVTRPAGCRALSCSVATSAAVASVISSQANRNPITSSTMKTTSTAASSTLNATPDGRRARRRRHGRGSRCCRSRTAPPQGRTRAGTRPTAASTPKASTIPDAAWRTARPRAARPDEHERDAAAPSGPRRRRATEGQPSGTSGRGARARARATIPGAGERGGRKSATARPVNHRQPLHQTKSTRPRTRTMT